MRNCLFLVGSYCQSTTIQRSQHRQGVSPATYFGGHKLKSMSLTKHILHSIHHPMNESPQGKNSPPPEDLCLQSDDGPVSSLLYYLSKISNRWIYAIHNKYTHICACVYIYGYMYKYVNMYMPVFKLEENELSGKS